jgi:hypothetical protein
MNVYCWQHVCPSACFIFEIAVLKAVQWILANFALYILILILLFMQFILNSESTDFHTSVLNS